MRNQVGLAVEDLSQQRPRIAAPRHFLSQRLRQSGCGSIGDHLDAVDEVLFLDS